MTWTAARAFPAVVYTAELNGSTARIDADGDDISWIITRPNGRWFHGASETVAAAKAKVALYI